ncbi:MAG: MFS transporter, partial [Pseudomonadota bacterium]
HPHLSGGAMGDRFGVARVFVVGIAIFIVASLASALAPSPEFLIVARALKGVGAALMVPGSLALIYRAFPAEERGRAIGVWAAASALTTALGPILGGAAITLLGDETWRWLFAINLPLGVISIALLWRAVDDDVSHPENGVDIPGAALIAFGLGAISWALTSGNGTGPWLWAGLAGITGFVFWERIAPHPMLPLGLFRSMSFSAANLLTFTLYFALSAILFFLPMTVISTWGVSEAEASFAFLPLTLFIAGLSTRFGAMADRVGPGPLIGAGAALVALAYAGLGLAAPVQAFWWGVLPAMCVMGLGMSMVVAPLSAAVMGAVTDDAAGAASGVNNAVSRVAGLVAVAAIGAMAATVYAGAGGPESFGVESEAAGHAAATALAFQRIAWVTAALAALSAAIAILGIRAPRADTP